MVTSLLYFFCQRGTHLCQEAVLDLVKTHSLVIHEIFPEDAGTYTCEAFNDVGECFSSCTLVVQVPGEEVFAPRFKRFPVSLSVEKGAAASFEAELHAAPATVAWMKDGRELKELPMKYRSVLSLIRVNYIHLLTVSDLS